MKNFKNFLLIILIGLLSLGCDSKTDQQQVAQPDTASFSEEKKFEAISLLGDTLYATRFSEEQQRAYTSALKAAQAAYQQNPANVNYVVQLGSSLTRLQFYRDAINIYSKGLSNFPKNAGLYQYRGQCYITTRQFDKAIADLEKSAQLLSNPSVTIKPEASTATRIPDLSFDVYYNLGVAYYLSGQYGKAAQMYEKCLTYAQKDQETAAAADWLYMTYRRLGEDEIAEKTLDIIKDELDRYDQEGYFERIMMYKGLVEPETLLQYNDSLSSSYSNSLMTANTYGVGNYYLTNGEEENGYKLLHKVVDSKYWVGLGYIAAEADLARMQQEDGQ